LLKELDKSALIEGELDIACNCNERRPNGPFQQAWDWPSICEREDPSGCLCFLIVFDSLDHLQNGGRLSALQVCAVRAKLKMQRPIIIKIYAERKHALKKKWNDGEYDAVILARGLVRLGCKIEFDQRNPPKLAYPQVTSAMGMEMSLRWTYK